MIEKHITDYWPDLCGRMSYEYMSSSGKRTIYDMACQIDNTLIGLDVRTKDLDSGRYSDGGVCAVDNLLRFLVNQQGLFLLIEVGHSDGGEHRSIDYIEVVPLHMLPADAYRIENLGTGQVRLNGSMKGMQVDWSRSVSSFLNLFTEIAMTHYDQVCNVARKRLAIIQRFREAGCSVPWLGMRITTADSIQSAG